MGVRLYPSTKTPANLEVLAGVPNGTYRRLKEFEAAHVIPADVIDFIQRGELEYKHHQELHKDKDLGTLDSFITFGWGRFHNPYADKDAYAGEFTGSEVIEVLAQNGIKADPDLCEGLHYC